MDTDKNLITWANEYLIGDEKIDDEHQTLFYIAKRAEAIKDLSKEEEQKKLLKEIVQELEYYVNLHFNNEEKFMNSINYPEIKEHLQKHKKMLEMLLFIELNLDLISVDEINYNLYDFIQNIFVNHIINEDTKIIEYKKETNN